MRGPISRWCRIAPLAIGLFVLAGCVTDHHDDDDCCWDDGRAPLPPVGVTSVTADRAVLLSWIPNQEADLAGYRVYVSRDPYGPYERLGYTEETQYWHRGIDNGMTFYYGVSAVDEYGHESELNDEIIYDTPRPEGSVVLFEADGDDDDLSAFDFSSQERVHWSSSRADVFFDRVGEIPFLAVPDLATDIQDAGFVGFDEITWAPDGGWSPSGAVEAIEGHVYVIWTRNDHYAKVRVIEVNEDFIDLDWAYQVDRGNPELIRGSTDRRPRITAAGN